MRMKEITIKIWFDDQGGYKGHGDDTVELILDGLNNFMDIDLESDGVIKKGWKVELVEAVK